MKRTTGLRQLDLLPARSTDAALGARLRDLRSAHELSLRELGAQVGLSPSFLSEVERGIVEPSISALKRIAAALDVRLEYFFTHDITWDATAGVAMITQGAGSTLSAATGVLFERLTPDWAEAFEVLYGTYQPGASIGEDQITHEGFEWAMVLAGRFKIWLGSQVLFLDPGGCLTFRSGIPHRVQNISDEIGRYVWVNSPPSF